MSGATVFLDWAGAGEIRDENCFAAVVTVLWEPVEKWKYDDLMEASAYGYVFSEKMLRGSRTQQLEAHIQELVKVRSFLAQRQPRANYFLRCEGFVDTTGDMKNNFDRVYKEIRTKHRVKESVSYVPRIKRKDDRIAALETPIENGWLSFSTELSKPYMDQMRTFHLAHLKTVLMRPKERGLIQCFAFVLNRGIPACPGKNRGVRKGIATRLGGSAVENAEFRLTIVECRLGFALFILPKVSNGDPSRSVIAVVTDLGSLPGSP